VDLKLETGVKSCIFSDEDEVRAELEAWKGSLRGVGGF